ncbi:hypothetical protein THRCLA_23055 [Thraustotheca clavata]|uniref:Uncharacterized protein n=1 Tax=Thraustotheca clavata TaxID=74557 RepID=A0A1V9YHE4_9STRA|nr:hypothetical protein THRCLA_23055 [Thraustotheca clavata]
MNDLSNYFENKGYPEFIEKKIHVLAVLPLVKLPESSATIFDKKIDEIYEHVVQSKEKTYVHSLTGSTKGKELLQDLNIRVEPVGAVPFNMGSEVVAFKWENDQGQQIVFSERRAAT